MEINQNLFENIQKCLLLNNELQNQKEKLAEEKQQLEEKINSNNQTVDYLYKYLTGQTGFMGSKDLSNSGNIITNKIESDTGHLYLKGREGDSFGLILQNPKEGFHKIVENYRELICFMNSSQTQYTQDMKSILPWKDGNYTLEKIVIYIPLNNEQTEWEMHSHIYSIPLEIIYDGVSFHMKRYSLI